MLKLRSQGRGGNVGTVINGMMGRRHVREPARSANVPAKWYAVQPWSDDSD